jgi:predicted nucleic acid-binding protein
MNHRPLALLDACVLVPMPLADTLLRLAEMSRTLVRRFAKTPASAQYREAAMRKFFPHALVYDYELLINPMGNHPKDRHVLATALACKADYLVTFTLVEALRNRN